MLFLASTEVIKHGMVSRYIRNRVFLLYSRTLKGAAIQTKAAQAGFKNFSPCLAGFVCVAPGFSRTLKGAAIQTKAAQAGFKNFSPCLAGFVCVAPGFNLGVLGVSENWRGYCLKNPVS
jgi:hypothetical protein